MKNLDKMKTEEKAQRCAQSNIQSNIQSKNQPKKIALKMGIVCFFGILIVTGCLVSI